MRRLLLALLLFLLPAAAGAQDTQIIVNGNPLPQADILGSTGSDVAVKATPYFRAAGAQVKVQGNRLEAQWTGTILVIEAGNSKCLLNGTEIGLSLPPGMLEGDLVIPVCEVSKVLNARVEEGQGGITIWNDTLIGNGNIGVGASAPASQNNWQGSPAEMGPGNGGAFTGNGGFPPGFATLTGTQMSSSGAIPGTGGLPEATAQSVMGMPFPQAGMGGLTSKPAENSSPYDRPVVSASSYGNQQFTVEVPRNIDEVAAYSAKYGQQDPYGYNQQGGMSPGIGVDQFGMPIGMSGNTNGNYGISSYASGNPNPTNYNAQANASSSTISYSEHRDPNRETGKAAGRSEKQPLPAKAEIVNFDARRIMTFHHTNYEVTAKVRNDGELAFSKPFVLQLLARSKRYEHYELLETYLIEPLQPGQEVEVTKRVDGHQFPSLIDLTVTFKAIVLEEAPPRVSNASKKAAPKHTYGSGKTYGTENSDSDSSENGASGNNGAATPQVRETCSKTKTLHF
ncbi:MAG: hypothetical protein K6G50_07355 [bacterium]|nr:hypothetical protein [bacterium]